MATGKALVRAIYDIAKEQGVEACIPSSESVAFAMAHTFSRQELFDLVWSEPTRTIAKRLGISDVGLAKACRRADLLLPPRGYWAKLAAGKTVKKPQMPTRGPGMSDRIVLSRDRWNWGPNPVDLSTPDAVRRHCRCHPRSWGACVPLQCSAPS